MTAYNHTDIPFNEDADSAVVNLPLGQLDAAIGNVAALTTTADADTVVAINELDANIGDLALLGTTTRTSLVAAIGSAALRTDYKLKLIPAINELLDRVVTAQSELDVAASPYDTLVERLNALVVAGGNIATKTSGVSAAGQKVVTVDSTTGFIVGSYVVYYLNGTTLEGNVIASIQAGVSLTMVNNIGATPAGGVLDDTPISMISISEYLAAQAIPHAGTLLLPDTMGIVNDTEYHVEAYGASPSANAATNTAAIMAAVAASSGGTFGPVAFGPGTFTVTGDVITLARVEETNRAVPIFKGAGQYATKLVLESGDDGAILTVTGSWQIRNMAFEGNVVTGGIGSGGTGAFVRRMTEGGGFFDCYFGKFDYGIKTDTYQTFASGSAMQGTVTERCYFEACAEAGVYLESVMNANHFNDCVFANGFPSDAGTHLGLGIHIGSYTSNILINGCQFLSHKHGIFIHGNAAGININDCYFETVFAESGAYIVTDGLGASFAPTTLADGAASAGQKIVTVDSTLGFDTDYVHYTLVGGVVERNKVGTVDSSTQMTLINDIGTGGIANNSPITQVSISTNLAITGCVNAFYYDSGAPHHVFLQLRDARAVTLMHNWSGSYGKGYIDITDDYGVALDTVRGLVMVNNRNEHANTKMFVNDDMGNGCVAYRVDVTDKDTFHVPHMWLPKTINSVADRTGVHSFVFYVDGAIGLQVTDSYTDLAVGAKIGSGDEIAKYYGKKDQALDFGSIAANTTAELTVTITGAAVGDQVIVAPKGTLESGLVWCGYVSSTNTVTVRLGNVTVGAIDPGARYWTISVIQHA